MCGIAGIYNKDTSLLNHSVKHVDNMLNKMEKRGPDNRGKFLSKSNKVVLGHNRLSIQDLDKRSNQPFVSKDGRYTLVFNGEIYNFKELRHQYLQGVDFRTESDTEVLLEMFQLMGIKALDYFKGMFSFAIWDEYEENLILVRDPYGIKPLYYAHGEFGFCFSSQVQPISDCLPGMNTMEPAGLVGFYMWGNVPEPWTLYKDVLQVPKGSYIVVKEGEIVEEKNWYSFSQHWENQNRSEIDLRLIVKNSVSESVKRHLVSDVPVCVFLSGGIDSCAVASLASQYNNRIDNKEPSWNFGPNKKNFKKVIDIIRYINKFQKFDYKLLKNNKIKETNILKLDSTKAKKELKWFSKWDLNKALKKTIEWNILFKKGVSVRDLCEKQFLMYIKDK